MYTFRELVELLTLAGFEDRVEAYGSLTDEPFRLGSRQLLLTAVAGKGPAGSRPQTGV